MNRWKRLERDERDTTIPSENRGHRSSLGTGVALHCACTYTGGLFMGNVQRLRSGIRTGFTISALLSGFLIVGCGPNWTVVRQDPHSMLSRVRTVEVEPIQVDQPRIGDISEQSWLAKKTPEQRGSWAADKAAMDEWFYKGLSEGLKDKGISLARGEIRTSAPRLRAVVSRIEPGFYAGIASSPSEIDVRLQIVEGNAVSHEITYQSNGRGLSTGERARDGASQAGYLAAEYLDSQIKTK